MQTILLNPLTRNDVEISGQLIFDTEDLSRPIEQVLGVTTIHLREDRFVRESQNASQVKFTVSNTLDDIEVGGNGSLLKLTVIAEDGRLRQAKEKVFLLSKVLGLIKSEGPNSVFLYQVEGVGRNVEYKVTEDITAINGRIQSLTPGAGASSPGLLGTEFTSFELGGYSVLEVGDSIPAGLGTFNWGTDPSGNVVSNSIAVKDITNATTLGSGLADDGTENLTLPLIQKLVPDSHVFQIEGTDTNSNIFTKQYVVDWKLKLYYGRNAQATPLDETQIEALSDSVLQTGFDGDYNFEADASYLYVAIPSSFGSPEIFLDRESSINVAMEPAYTVSVTNSFGVVEDYDVYRSTNILNSQVKISIS